MKRDIKMDHPAEMKAINYTNPDIGLTQEGNIALKNPYTGKTVATDTPFAGYKKD